MSSPRVASTAASLDPKASGASSEAASSSVVADLVEKDEACTLIEPSKKQHKRTDSNVNNPPHLFAENTLILKHKRRYCKIEGCNSIVKSQGLCQRHGAKPKTCKVEGCTKQAQGNFDKMCKAHFKAMKRMTTPIPKVENKDVPPPAQGFSVYDSILPDSLNFVVDEQNNDTRKLPLIVHLKEGFDTLKPPAWHRNEERRARGMFPIDNPAAQLEGWERELVWMEILVLTGVPGASFRHLARAWGRDKGFHMVLAQFICERHGDVERKKRHGEKKGDAKKKRQKVASPKKALSNSDSKAESDNGAYNGNEDVGADVWDPSLYGDVDTNEALAAEIFDFTEKEFERVVSKYRQEQPSGDSLSTSTAGDRNISISSTTTDIVTQAAMTAILGQQQQQQQPMHHRSNSMHSTASNNNHEDILPTPVHVEVAPGVATNPMVVDAPGATSLPHTIPNTPLAPGYHNQVPPNHYTSPQQQPHQVQELMPQQQQVFQHPAQVPAPPPPPMQVPGHVYPPQQHIPGQSAPHPIIQQQMPAYSMHPGQIVQAQPTHQGEPQPVAQQMPTSIQAPMQQVHQPEAHAQPYSQQQAYALPPGQPQQPLAPVPVAAPASQFPHSQPPVIHPQHAQPQQGHQQQYDVNLPSYPQHKQEPFNPPGPQHHEDVSYERKLLSSYETAVSANPPTQQSHSIAQQPLVAPHPHQQSPQQQHQLPIQYAQPTSVPGPAPVDLVSPQQPQAQHQAPFPPGEQQQQQQMHPQIETHQASGQQIVHAPYPPPPPQQHAQPQEHTNQLMNHPDHEAPAQDPLDVHHEMNAAREDQT